jgi:hypothetical protein
MQGNLRSEQIDIVAPGGGGGEGVIAWSKITRLQSDVDPNGNTTLLTGSGVSVGHAVTRFVDVGLNGVQSTPLSVDELSGCVVDTANKGGACVRNFRYYERRHG